MASVVKKVVKVFELPESERTIANRWANEDITPVKPEKRTWGKNVMKGG